MSSAAAVFDAQAAVAKLPRRLLCLANCRHVAHRRYIPSPGAQSSAADQVGLPATGPTAPAGLIMLLGRINPSHRADVCFTHSVVQTSGIQACYFDSTSFSILILAGNATGGRSKTMYAVVTVDPPSASQQHHLCICVLLNCTPLSAVSQIHTLDIPPRRTCSKVVHSR